MTTRAPVSVCIICRDEPLLGECLESIRDFVEEIIVVDTGSAAGAQCLVDAKRLADRLEIFHHNPRVEHRPGLHGLGRGPLVAWGGNLGSEEALPCPPALKYP